MHLDEDVARTGHRLVDVDHPHVRGTGGLEDLDSAHALILPHR